MEKRIKTLYIITIIAILAFLAMQVYWLYGRYEFSLNEYERSLGSAVIGCVEDYAALRNEERADHRRPRTAGSRTDSLIEIPTFEIQHRGTYGDSVNISRKSTIKTYLFSAQELLGLEPGAKLTEEQQIRAAELAEMKMKEPADSAVFDASGAKDETEAWIATSNVSLERKSPFTVQGMDSVLKDASITAEISIARSDTAVWKTKIVRRHNLFRPQLSITVPYSQLEGRTVTIVCHINPLEVIPDMWQTLFISLLVSVFLIVCLVSQFATVLKLSRLDRMRNGFITTMIHELKRPISTLKMCISGLDNDRMVEDRDTKTMLLAETRNALDNLSAYFSKLRDITFNDVEQIPLNIRNVNLHELFENVASAIVIPPDKSVVISNKIDEDVEVSADRSHLFNVLNNLVENAIKYSGSSVEIIASSVCGNGKVELHVCDNGNGISSGDMKHIFRCFYRGKATAGEQPGMGLGLAYVKLLVDAHGGDISVESSEGKGSCFTISLPQ